MGFMCDGVMLFFVAPLIVIIFALCVLGCVMMRFNCDSEAMLFPLLVRVVRFASFLFSVHNISNACT